MVMYFVPSKLEQQDFYTYLVVHKEGKFSYPCGAKFLEGKYSNARLLTKEEADVLLASLKLRFPDQRYELLEIIPF